MLCVRIAAFCLGYFWCSVVILLDIPSIFGFFPCLVVVLFAFIQTVHGYDAVVKIVNISILMYVGRHKHTNNYLHTTQKNLNELHRNKIFFKYLPLVHVWNILLYVFSFVSTRYRKFRRTVLIPFSIYGRSRMFTE